MLENFQLATIVKHGTRFRLLRVPLHQTLQDSLAETWERQYDAFIDGLQEIAFDVGYRPEGQECFGVPGYELPLWLADEDSETVPDLDAISDNEAMVDHIKGIVALAQDDHGEELMLFQNFTPSKVIRPGLFLFLQRDTYESAERPGLTLDRKLSAVYRPADERLFFRNFHTVNSFLSLSDFYKEASEGEIRNILAHERLAPEDVDVHAESASQWFRKRFAMLRDSGILDQFTADDIRGRSDGYDVVVQIVDDRIVFPADKSEAKKLLQFLNEELFRGPITQVLYETNSRRRAGA